MSLPAEELHFQSITRLKNELAERTCNAEHAPA
jgi:hypothetical protein